MKAIQITTVCAVILSGCWSSFASEPTRFTKEQLKLPGKKGACFTLKQEEGKLTEAGTQNMARVKALNVS